MSPQKALARKKKFAEALGSGKIVFRRCMLEIQREISQICLSAKVLVQSLDIIAFTLPTGLFGQIFDFAAGVVLVYSDGRVFYAPRPIQL